MDTLEFFEAIYGDLSGFVNIVTRDPDSREMPAGRWFDTTQMKVMAEKYCIQLRSEEEVYCSVAVFQSKERRASSVGTMANVVWADADTCDPSNFRTQPSIIVQTSPDRWHCWWVLDYPVPVDDASQVAQKIAYAHRDQGCDTGWNASKLLRVPGTTNLKYEQPYKVTATDTGARYSIMDLEELYGDVSSITHQALSTAVPELLSTTEQIDLEERVIQDRPWEDLYLEAPGQGVDWSNRLFRLQHELFREGCTPQEVFTLSTHAACNKFRRDNRPESDLWETVQKAFVEYQGEDDAPDTGINPTARAIPEFLTDEEKALLPRTFVDDYTEYIGEKTQADPRFQRSLAYMLLSCLFGDKAYLPVQYSDGNLNLWMLLLGGTTTYKTTSKNLMTKMLREFEDLLIGYPVDIGSEATSEALATTLGPRDGKTSLFSVDEVSKTFEDAYRKQHQAGFLARMTDLYEGDVPVVLRASKGAGQSERAKTVFNFLGVGVPTAVAEVLSKKDFESGFLARMLWCVVGDKPRQHGSERPRWRKTTPQGKDVEQERFLMKVKAAMRNYTSDYKIEVTMPEDVEDRYTEWTEVVMQYTESLREPVLMAGAKRMLHSTVKAAALLSLYHGYEEIQMLYLNTAIAQARLWYSDMLTMFSQVSSSGFERMCDDFEQYIALGENGERKDSAIKRQFPMRPQDSGDVLRTLREQGRIRREGDVWKALVV